ncbi:MAG: Flp pilus assembly protein CpaB [Sphingobium sp.]|nr:Flp pilus assembly protein CpaB [Sphingobium sp.]
MDVKKAALLAGALIIAIAAALMARSMFAGNPDAGQNVTQQQVEEGPQVLVATAALPVGTIITEGSFRFQPWPKDLIEDAYYLKDKADLAKLQGAVVRTAIATGQPITVGSLIQPGERGFLAAALGPGMRAITVPVSVQTAVAGFVFPGDRVDLLMTQTITGSEEDNSLKVAQTVVRNLRVLATDQRTDALNAEGKPEVRTYSNVTLEVTPKIAEKIAVAQNVGALSLALRSIADNAQDLDAAIAGGNVDMPGNNDPAAEKRALSLARAGQPEDRTITFSTGADVSRFERRTAPQRKTPQQQQQEAAKPTGPVVNISRGGPVQAVELKGK